MKSIYTKGLIEVCATQSRCSVYAS